MKHHIPCHHPQKKTPVLIGLYEKKAWQRRVAARAIEGYKAGEVAALSASVGRFSKPSSKLCRSG